MNRVYITTVGPIMENLAQITVSDDYENDTFCIDYKELESAKEDGRVVPSLGQRNVLDLIYNNGGTDSVDILQAAVMNGSPVTIDGEDIPADVLKAVFNAPTP